MPFFHNTLTEIVNFVFLPIRVLCPDSLVERTRLRTLETERIRICLKFATGFVLDVGCGKNNRLVTEYGHGIGVDVSVWPTIDVLCDTEKMPFNDASFDTVTLLASLNYIPRKQNVLREVRRVLKRDGIVLVTMISPFVGFLHHRIFRLWNFKRQKEIGQTEVGLSRKRVQHLFSECGIEYKQTIPFVYGLNTLHVGSCR